MPFTFIDIEKKQNRKIIMLFFTLVVFYFAGALLLELLFKITLILELTLHSSRYRHLRHELFSLYPSVRTVLILFIIAFVIALIHWNFSTKNMIKRILTTIGAKPLDPEDRYHLLLKNIIDEVSIATGGIKIEPYVVPSRYLNAFALSDFYGRSVIGITEGLLVRINRQQLEGVIAHEAAHLVWKDSLSATVSCSMAGVYAGAMRIIFDPNNRNPIKLPLSSFPVMFVVFIMRFLTLFLNTCISRKREIRADATAVRLTRNPLGLAESLYLISKNWRGNFLPIEELSPIFIVNPHERKLEESYNLFANLFTTHPPIKQRLNILLDMAHVNYTILESNTKEKPKTQEEIPMVSSEAENEKIWYALNEKIWQGPFCLKELVRLQYIGPFTWVTKAHDMKVKSAFEYKEINELLENKQSSDLRIRTCPSCNKKIEKIYYKGIPIWRCTSCKGCLVNKDRLSRVIARESMVFSDKVKEKAKQMTLDLKQKVKYKEVSKSAIRCPYCNNVMHRILYSAAYPYRMEIDTCENCNFFWFDQQELELIQYIL